MIAEQIEDIFYQAIDKRLMSFFLQIQHSEYPVSGFVLFQVPGYS